MSESKGGREETGIAVVKDHASMRIRMRLRLDSLFYLSLLWLFNVLMPFGFVACLLVALVPEFLRQPWPVWLFVAMMGGGMFWFGKRMLTFMRTFSCGVTLDRTARQVVYGGKVWPVEGAERCVLAGTRQWSWLELTLADGTFLRMMPTLSSYEDIRREGAQTWWQGITRPLPDW